MKRPPLRRTFGRVMLAPREAQPVLEFQTVAGTLLLWECLCADCIDHVLFVAAYFACYMAGDDIYNYFMQIGFYTEAWRHSS